jgi:hypothetical protein
MSRFSAFGTTLDPLDTDRGTTIGTFSASVPTGSGLRGSGVASGTSGTQKGVFKMDKTLTTKLPPVSPKIAKRPPVLVKPAPLAKPSAPRAATPGAKPGALAPRGMPTPKRFTPSRASLPGGRPAVSVPAGSQGTYVDTTGTTPTLASTPPTGIVLTDTSALTVTSTPTGSEGSVWTDGSASYPTGEASSLSEQAQATVDAAATPTELVTDDEMTVSTDITTPEEGFFAKYKWWIAGGSVGAAGAYAYLHRMDPSKYPLPEMLSKLVRE